MSIALMNEVRELKKRVDALQQVVNRLVEINQSNPLVVDGQKQVVSGFDRTLTLDKRKA